MNGPINELAEALVAAQAQFPAIPKDSENPFFKSKYADLATVIKAAMPVLTKNGLAISQGISHYEGQSTLKTYLIHKSGQFIVDEMPLMPVKNDPQSQGSAITYARRYSYMAVLGLVADEDDDGNAATAGSTTQTTRLATTKQIDLIKNQLKTKGITKGEYIKTLFDAWLNHPFTGFENLNSEDASSLIDYLLKTTSADLKTDLINSLPMALPEEAPFGQEDA